MEQRFKEVATEKEFDEEVVDIARVSRTVKGGRRIRFRAAVVLGNRAGKIGMGIGKANDVMSAVNKAKRCAKRNIFVVPIISETIPHRVEIKDKAAKIILMPASQGSGVIAGGVVRIIADLSGIKNMLSKSLGTNNKISCMRATMKGLKSFKTVTRKDENYANNKKINKK